MRVLPRTAFMNGELAAAATIVAASAAAVVERGTAAAAAIAAAKEEDNDQNQYPRAASAAAKQTTVIASTIASHVISPLSVAYITILWLRGKMCYTKRETSKSDKIKQYK